MSFCPSLQVTDLNLFLFQFRVLTIVPLTMIYVPMLWYTYLSIAIRGNLTSQCSEIHHCQNAFIEFLVFHGCLVGMAHGDLGRFHFSHLFQHMER